MTGCEGMDRPPTVEPPGTPTTLEHEAFLYSDSASYCAGLVPFIREGLARGEPVLAAVPKRGLDLLRSALDERELDRVTTTDMSVVGRNPGRIIGSVLTKFLADHPRTGVRIIGELAWAGRNAEEYPASAEHEALINVALAGSPVIIRCPYDVTRLKRSVLVDATRTHPFMTSDAERWTSPGYTDPVATAQLFDHPLAPTPADADVMVISHATGARAARRFVHDFGTAAGMSPERLGDLRLATQELAINTLLHSGGHGLLSVWAADGQVVCQVEDGGHISSPLVGRHPPRPQDDGHGLYIVHQVCDLVRVHRRSGGTTIRVFVNLR
jgi:anti-sigma regulatory factor (Ser/Thr protein kinase)